MLKRLLIVPLLLLGLAGCAGTPAGNFIRVATSTVVNPVSTTDIYRANNVYAATLEIANAYRKYCWSKPYAVLMQDPIAKPVCQNRRPVVRDIQAADDKAFLAIQTATRFVRDNPTLNASSVISAMWSAVNAYQSLTGKSAVVGVVQ